MRSISLGDVRRRISSDWKFSSRPKRNEADFFSQDSKMSRTNFFFDKKVKKKILEGGAMNEYSNEFHSSLVSDDKKAYDSTLTQVNATKWSL